MRLTTCFRDIECSPQGHLLFINNNDKPGLVGAVGTVLSDANINIAAISLGRESQDGVASSIVNIDGEISEEVIEKLKNTEGVLYIKELTI